MDDREHRNVHVLTMIETAQRAGRSEAEIVRMVERELATPKRTHDLDERRERRHWLRVRGTRAA